MHLYALYIKKHYALTLLGLQMQRRLLLKQLMLTYHGQFQNLLVEIVSQEKGGSGWGGGGGREQGM